MGLVTRASDTFTRADSTTTLGSAETGGAWTAHVGTWGISSNQAYLATHAGANAASVDSGYSDGFLSCSLPTSPVASQGLLFRLSDASNFWVWRQNATATVLYKTVAGVETAVTSISTTPTDGQVLRVTMEGTRIHVESLIAGAVVASTVTFDTFNQTATKHGLRTAGAANATARWDSFLFQSWVEQIVVRRKGPGPIVEEFTASGSWTKPAGAKWVEVTCIGGGGGGGSGRTGIAGGIRMGGSGGSAGGLSFMGFRAADLDAVVAVTVGAGGAGGAGGTGSTGTGLGGAVGGMSSFGSYLRATNGTAGPAGNNTSPVAGAAAGTTVRTDVGGAGIGSTAGSDGGSAVAQTISRGPGGGGAAGNIDVVVAATNGGAGGATLGNTAGGTAGTSGAAGGAGNSDGYVGTGGGGGGASSTAAAGAGGTGGLYGGAGGGGGAVLTGFNSGAGGAGGQGIVVVQTWT